MEASLRNPDLVNRPALTGLYEYAKVDGLLLNSPKNVYYFSGSPTAIPDVHMTPYYDPAAPSASLVLTLIGGESVLFVSDDDAAANRERAWAAVRAYEAWPGTAVEPLVAELRSRGLDDAVLG